MKTLHLAIIPLFLSLNIHASVCTLKDKNGKSGTLICKTEEGKLLREAQVQDGKEIGKVVLINNQGNREEFNQNEKGNVIGNKKILGPKGNLLYEGRYENGEPYGIHKKYYPSEKLESLIHYPDMRIDYSETGAILQLSCGKVAYLDEDKKLCGWNKVSNLTINDRKYTYENGKLIKFQDFYSKGKIKTENAFKGNTETRKTFYANGKLKTLKTLEDKVLKTEKDFYKDGTRKGDFVFELRDGATFIKKKTYYSNGNPEVEGLFRRDATRGYDYPVGLRKTYYEITGLAYEENHNEKGELDGESVYYGESGQVSIRKVYKDGKLISEKNF